MTIGSIFSKVKEVPLWKIVLLGIVIFLSVLVWQDYKESSSYVPTVIHSNVEWFENKKGEVYKAELAAILKAKDLQKQYEDLYEEYEKLKKEKPLVITNTITETRVDSIFVPTSVVHGDSAVRFDWTWHKDIDTNNYLHFEGYTSADSLLQEAYTSLSKIRIGSDLVLDFISNKDYPTTLQVIARSNNPYVSIVSTEGAIIDPLKNPAIKALINKNKPKWSIGFQGGIGLQYDMFNQRVGAGPYIGIGITKTISF